MRIVLIGDLHFYKLGVWPWELLGKRLWGQMNLWLNRRLTFKLSRLAALEDRVHALRPDLLLFSGDLVTTALTREFTMACAALRPLLMRYPAVIVPGNHDRHSFTAMRRRYLERAFPHHVPHRFPHHRDLGGSLHLIALDPTRANLISDRGLIGPRQLDQVQRLLGELPAEARVIVLCHYTLGMPPGLHHEASRHRLIDEEKLRGVLAVGGRETLYLHGHVHVPFCWRQPAAENVVSVNAGAPLMHDARWPGGQGFWEIQTGPPWRLIHHAPGADEQWVEDAAEMPVKPGGAVTFRGV
jgi:3',5'-cyclic AMP phosphodiesterase CpdA